MNVQQLISLFGHTSDSTVLMDFLSDNGVRKTPKGDCVTRVRSADKKYHWSSISLKVILSKIRGKRSAPDGLHFLLLIFIQELRLICPSAFPLIFLNQSLTHCLAILLTMLKIKFMNIVRMVI